MSHIEELIEVSNQGDIEKVKGLVELGVDADGIGRFGFTPLMKAAENGHIEVVKYLIEKGADVNKKNKLDWNPLCYATTRNHGHITRILLEHGADINAYCEGLTILMMVINQRDNRIGMVKLLVDHGADINAKNLSSKYTTLQFAYLCKEHGIAKYLKGLGAEGESENEGANINTTKEHIESETKQDTGGDVTTPEYICPYCGSGLQGMALAIAQTNIEKGVVDFQLNCSSCGRNLSRKDFDPSTRKGAKLSSPEEEHATSHTKKWWEFWK